MSSIVYSSQEELKKNTEGLIEGVDYVVFGDTVYFSMSNEVMSALAFGEELYDDSPCL